MSEQSQQPPQPKQVVNLLRLGTSDYGLMQAGINARIVGGQIIISVGLVGGKVSPVLGFLPLEITLQKEDGSTEIARMSVAKAIKLFEAQEAAKTAAASPLIQLAK